MPDPSEAQIAALRALIASLRPESPMPEPSPSMYGVSPHPDVAHEQILASGHGVGGHAGLGAAVTN